MDKKLITYLTQRDIRYTVYNHPAIFTVSESKKLNLKIPGAHTKNLFLKDEKLNFYLICCLGDKRVNLKELKKHLSVKELHFASLEELKKELQTTPGSVSLFAMIYSSSVKLLLDQEIWDSDLVGFHPNVNTSTLVLTHKDLKIFYDSLKCRKEVLKIA
ncbi:MAG: prolyl-tRNA synthetase associated domain-containing protein [Nanoarchaeota archaeon]